MFILQLMYGIFESFWRRWFGGGDIGGESKENKWYNKRWFKHIIGGLVTFVVLFLSEYNLIQCILATVVLQGLYWARAHGEFFDFGHSNPPDISRYEKEWWWKYVREMMPESVWYTYSCDYICMFVRYTLPSILLSIILMSISPLALGLIVSSTYAVMWCYHDWFGLKNPTEVSEHIAGFYTGIFLLG